MLLYRRMASGISDGVLTPKQPGVIVREGENFPRIPKRLLKLTPDELQERIDGIVKSLEFRRDPNRIFHDVKLEEQLEMSQVVCEFAKTAVERQRRTVERE